jgi:hypothetical protein
VWFAGSNRSVKKIGLPVTGTKSTIAASVNCRVITEDRVLLAELPDIATMRAALAGYLVKGDGATRPIFGATAPLRQRTAEPFYRLRRLSAVRRGGVGRTGGLGRTTPDISPGSGPGRLHCGWRRGGYIQVGNHSIVSAPSEPYLAPTLCQQRPLQKALQECG